MLCAVGAMASPPDSGAIGTTLIFTVISVALESLFGLGIALLINREFRGRGLVRAAILVPWAFPTVVSAQMWLLMYNDQTGIITYLEAGGTLENAQAMAAHESLRTTKLYDRTGDVITLDEVERWRGL